MATVAKPAGKGVANYAVCCCGPTPTTGRRPEGRGHKPVFLQHFSGEAPGDSGASPREAASRLPDPLEQRTPGSGSGAQGDGMASRWLAVQATTTRQKSQLSSDRTNQVIVNNANCLVQAQLAGGARFRTGNPVVSYSRVRAGVARLSKGPRPPQKKRRDPSADHGGERQCAARERATGKGRAAHTVVHVVSADPGHRNLRFSCPSDWGRRHPGSR